MVALGRSAGTSRNPGWGPGTGTEISAVSTAAQWLVAAAGAVGAILVAGLQLGDIGKHRDRPDLMAVSTLSFLVAMVLVGFVMRKASRVLVLSRTTVSDILDAELAARLRHSRRISLKRPVSKAMREVIVQIADNRDWLLGQHDSTASLYASYRQLEQNARPDPGRGSGAAADIAGLEHEMTVQLDKICEFARSELSRREYRKLAGFITGYGGMAFAVTVIVFAISLGWSTDESPAVDSPLSVKVILNHDLPALAAAGFPTSCLPGSALTGVAVGGSLAEPWVAMAAADTTVDGKASHCPALRFKAGADVATTIPIAAVR